MNMKGKVDIMKFCKIFKPINFEDDSKKTINKKPNKKIVNL